MQIIYRIILSLLLALQLSFAGVIPSHAHVNLKCTNCATEANDESWAEVVSVEIEQKALKACNLTVADFHTYFVRGADNDNAEAVWVHNDCFDDLAGSLGNMKRAEFEKLASGWGKGTFENLSDSLKHHADGHWGGDVAGYLRSASNFSTKGAKSTGIRVDGSIKYTKNGRFAVFKDGKMVTYGK